MTPSDNANFDELKVPDGLRDVSKFFDIPHFVFDALINNPELCRSKDANFLPQLMAMCEEGGLPSDAAMMIVIAGLWEGFLMALDALDEPTRSAILHELRDHARYAREHMLVPYYRKSYGDFVDDDAKGTIRVSASMTFDSATISEAITCFVNSMVTSLDPTNDDIVLKVESLPHVIPDPYIEASPIAVRFVDVQANQSKLVQAIEEYKENNNDN